MDRSGKIDKACTLAQLEHDFEIATKRTEIMGPWSTSGLKFVQEVVLMQAIGMAVQREYAASVLGTVRKGLHLEEIYYL